MMDNVKKAFQKVKQDIEALKQETNLLKSNLIETREKVIEICDILKQLSKDKKESSQFKPSILPKEIVSDISTDRHIIPTNPINPSTHNLYLEGLNSQNLPISTGNRGVSTDRQTDRQTDRHIENNPLNKANSIENALEILNSLDHVKKEIRLKFKRLTDQEILVFSTIYQLDEEIGPSDYKILSKKLNLTESSIRDYVGRLIKKGIPVEKNKINNKNIKLSIPKSFKKLATLSAVLQLREL